MSPHQKLPGGSGYGWAKHFRLPSGRTVSELAVLVAAVRGVWIAGGGPALPRGETKQGAVPVDGCLFTFHVTGFYYGNAELSDSGREGSHGDKKYRFQRMALIFVWKEPSVTIGAAFMVAVPSRRASPLDRGV